jgi:ergosteryl-3beta-O-L-aspartate synthase
MPSLKGTLSRLHARITKRSSISALPDHIRGGPEDEIRKKIELETESSSPRKSEACSERKSLGEFIGRDDPPEIRARYGSLPLMQSSEEHGETWTPISHENDISQLLGQDAYFRARLYVVRQISPKLVFLVLQDQLTTIQGVLEVEEGRISEHMVKWAQHVRTGSIIRVKGKVQAPREPVTGTSIHDAEILVEELHVVSERTASIPFSVYEAETNYDAKVSDRTRLHNRILDLRTPTSQGIFRIQSGVCNLFRSYLDSKGFTEIHTPKLQGGATEGGSSVFRLEYFGRPAFLAQSPQLAKQMCIAGDLGKVYEVGPVFRAGMSIPR